jgi:hypothetical protein
LDALPNALKERLAAEGLTGTLRIDFQQPAAQGSIITTLATGIGCGGCPGM